MYDVPNVREPDTCLTEVSSPDDPRWLSERPPLSSHSKQQKGGRLPFRLVLKRIKYDFNFYHALVVGLM